MEWRRVDRWGRGIGYHGIEDMDVSLDTSGSRHLVLSRISRCQHSHRSCTCGRALHQIAHSVAVR
jgi:hypothetical protein